MKKIIVIIIVICYVNVSDGGWQAPAKLTVDSVNFTFITGSIV